MTDGIKLRTFLLICICITLSACQSEVATDELVTPTLSTDHEQPASLVTTVSEETVPSVTTTNLEQPFPSVNTEESSGDGVNLNQGTKFPMFNANCAMDEPQRPLQVMKKFYNQTCEDDSECAQWSDASLVCKNGLCDCAENFVLPAMTFGPIQRCEPAPSFYMQPCFTTCRKPYVCKPIDQQQVFQNPSQLPVDHQQMFQNPSQLPMDRQQMFQNPPQQNSFQNQPQQNSFLFPSNVPMPSNDNFNNGRPEPNGMPDVMDQSRMGPSNGPSENPNEFPPQANRNGGFLHQLNAPSQTNENANGFALPRMNSNGNDFMHHSPRPNGNSNNFNMRQGNGQNFMHPNPAPPQFLPPKFCHCEKPYEMIGFHCVLVCKDDEFYDEYTAQCVKKCKNDEVQLFGNQCKPLVSLGGSCDNVVQCKSAYTECKNNTCSCRSGFNEKDGLCQPLNLKCPYGEPLKNENDFVACKVTREQSCPTCPIKIKDSCPDNYHCLVTNDLAENATGHCCMKSKIECPVGEPHESATCDLSKITPIRNNWCPPETHFCYPGSVTHPDRLCCPMPCPVGSVFVDNQCYRGVNIGDPCVHDEQCARAQHAKCTNGICKCDEKTTEMGSQMAKWCSITCNRDTEIFMNNECYSILILNDVCENQEWRCPMGSICDKQKKCSCACGLMPLGDSICAPPPMCFQPQFIHGEKISVKGSPEAAKKKPFQMPVPKFCRVKGKQPPMTDNIVDECKSDTYCSRYLRNLGLCCPLPPKLCPDGRPPISNKTCNGNDGSCGEDGFCHSPLTPADESSFQGICCHISFLNQVEK